MFLLDYFLYLWSFVFACLFILNGLNIVIIIKYTLVIIKLSIESLKIKNQSYYYWNDTIYIDDFDIKYLKINKRESQAGIDMYYISLNIL